MATNEELIHDYFIAKKTSTWEVAEKKFNTLINAISESSGSPGPQGETGADGPRGTQGLKGDAGDVGPQGPQGIQGTRGNDGSNGSQGIQGIQGIQGETGAAGAKGDTGNTGAKGDTGNTGAQGPQGPMPIGYVPLSNDTLAQALATNINTQLTVTAGRTLTTTVPAAGVLCSVTIVTSGTVSYTITFGTGFKPVGTLATGTVTAKAFVVNFRSDGTNLREMGRTAAMAV
jgi:hypothetical protein